MYTNENNSPKAIPLMEMDENETENNCFLKNEKKNEAGTVPGQHEVFLYDEAEPLAYGCSDTSMPPKVTSVISSSRTVTTIRDAEIIKKPTNKSVGSELLRNASEYYSVQSLPKNVKTVLDGNIRQGPGPNKVGENNFENAILSMYNEFSSSSKSLTQHKTEYYKNSTDECENTESSLSSARKVCRKKSLKVKEIFTRRLPIFESSSESEFSQSHGKHADEVLSTGASEIADEPYTVKDKTTDKPKNQTSDVQWMTSKSIAKLALGKGDTMRREQPDHTIRARSPHRKFSIKHLDNTAQPYSLFVEELKRNSLIMKEDIFSSSKSKTHVISKNSVSLDEERVSEVREEEIEQLPMTKVEKGVLEVFEATGYNSGWREKTPGFKDVQQPQLGCGPVIRKERIQLTERKTPGNTDQVKISYTSNDKLPQQTLTTKSIGINTNESTHSDSLTTGHNSNESKSSRIATPKSTSSRYVKLPGFPEAFVRDDTYVKELRIKDGLSFESINMCNTSSKITHEPSQFKVRFMEEQETAAVAADAKQTQIHDLREMKDESTDYELLLEHRLTQTSNDMIVEKLMADTSVQCESHVIDVVNDSIDYKNDHQEIMICNDHGRGVQLYNILGHPLTDMEGYLLKDSHGRFLVRFDHFGVPTTCTDGKTIFLEDGIKWEHVKGYLNIIHQRCKKNLANSMDRKKIKNMIEHPAKRHSENVQALRQSKQIRTLKWLGENSMSTLSDGISSQRIFGMRNDHNPLRQIQLKSDPVNTYGNTSTLVAEMKSIAKLRNALLEKINFIADHRDPPQKPRFSTTNEPRSHKSMKKFVMLPDPPETNWKSEPRIHLDRSRKLRPGFKSNRNFKKRRDTGDDHLNSFSKNRTDQRLYSPRALPLGIEEVQEMFPSTSSTTNWRPEAMAILLPEDRWHEPPSSTGLMVLRDENFPPVSETSSFEPWSEVSQANSNAESVTAQPNKWSAMRPSIEGDSEENGF